MTTSAPERLRYTYMSCFSPGALQASWNHPQSTGFDYLNLDSWVKLAQALEDANFDAFFWADHLGVHDIFRSSYEDAVRNAMQYPVADPMILAATLAASTTNLGFAFSANVIQDHPYVFARRLSTLDHLTRGRIAWNIVTSFQPSAWRNLGHSQMRSHDSRYEQADEYVQVLYKLLEGSWEDDAVVRDLEKAVYADPGKVHPIEHEGQYYKVPGIQTVEPSPQRMPVLFQAGTSTAGREFAANNAEAIFMLPMDPAGARRTIDGIRAQFVECGRRASDALFFVSESVIVGSTEEEAKRKLEEFRAYRHEDFDLIFASSNFGFDLSVVDPDTPIADLEFNAVQGQIRAFADSAPDKNLTLRDMAATLSANLLTVGTPEQIADKFEAWQAAGVNGINLASVGGYLDVYDFIEHVVPVLKKRGLMQKEYAPGTLREKLFAGTESPSGPRLNDRHPVSKFRKDSTVPA